MLFNESIKRFTPPKGWGWASIGDVAKLSFSSVDKKSVEGEKAVRLCNYMDVFYNRRIREGMPFMASTASDSDIKKFTLNKDDVVLTKDSETPEEIAFAAVIDEQIDNLVCGYHLAVLRPDQGKVTGEYLMSAINFHPNHHQFVRLANGATRFGLGIDSLNNALIPLPPLAEQRKIAEILRTWDEAIETAEAELKAKQERKRGLMIKCLGPAIEARGVNGWRTVRLGEICNPQQWTTIVQSQMTETGIPVYGANSYIGFFSEANHEDDVIAVSCRGSCGEVAFVSGPSYVTGNSMCLDDLSGDEADIYWLYQCLKLRGFRDIISGSAQPQIIRKDVIKVKISMPSLTEQKKAAEILRSADQDIETINNRIEALRTQKRGLMQKLLTGEVRVAA